jgi:aurora kinase
MNPKKKIIKNSVAERFFPIPQTVLKGLEPEPKIEDFTLLKELGSGSFGRVLLAEHKRTKARYALKAIDKRLKDNIEEKDYFRREMEIMYKIDHPNIVKLFGHFEDNTYCYFLMEYIPKGNLFHYIPVNGKPKINTQTAVSLLKDVISALYYLHHMSPPIIHRDIKPENILIDDQMRAKLSDFGWSTYLRGNFKRTTICGTPLYLAPEIIDNIGHDEKVDIWCVGVLMFELLTGKAPWDGEDVTTVKNNIRQLRINWPKNMDKDAKELISRILKYLPEERPSFMEILMYPFFTKYYPDAINCLQEPNYSNHNLYIISKDRPDVYNAHLSIRFENNIKSPYSNSINFTQSNYNNGQVRNTVYSTTKVNSIPYDITSGTGYSVTNANNNLFPLEYSLNRNSEYNINKIYSSLPLNNYHILENDYSINNNNNLSLKEEIENQERINELVRRTELVNNNTSYKNSMYNTLTFSNNYDFKNKTNLYQTQNGVQKPYTSVKNTNLYNSSFNDINRTITSSKIDYSLANNNLSNINSINYGNYGNYDSFILNDPDIIKWRLQEKSQRENERLKLSGLMNKYGMSLNPSTKINYNFV